MNQMLCRRLNKSLALNEVHKEGQAQRALDALHHDINVRTVGCEISKTQIDLLIAREQARTKMNEIQRRIHNLTFLNNIKHDAKVYALNQQLRDIGVCDALTIDEDLRLTVYFALWHCHMVFGCHMETSSSVNAFDFPERDAHQMSSCLCVQHNN